MRLAHPGRMTGIRAATWRCPAEALTTVNSSGRTGYVVKAWASDEKTMPWTRESFPASMRHLDPIVRDKAIDIANALLEEGMDEGKAIRVAVAKAKQWAWRRRWQGDTDT